MKFRYILLISLLLFSIQINANSKQDTVSYDFLKSGFISPPNSARPGVYWYFMDGNMSRDAMTKDLESMKKVGLGSVLFLEVDLGVPRGDVGFMSEKWLDHFSHAIREAERLGIEVTLGVGPGWTGSGGPWVEVSNSMRHLVHSSTDVTGNGKKQTIQLAKPDPIEPFFGREVFTPELLEEWKNYYEDVVVLAYPDTETEERIGDIYEKALYQRAPYSSSMVRSFIPEYLLADDVNTDSYVKSGEVIDVTKYMDADGTLRWQIPKGKWIIMRMGMRNNGAATRPAPYPGLGFESDKFDSTAFQKHFDHFPGKLIDKLNFKYKTSEGGLTGLHMDSWEMGAQNWTDNFAAEFKARRGYDPIPYLPAYSAEIIDNPEISERFLWDVRRTSQELVLEQHAGYIRKISHDYGLRFSIEPYDMNPLSDMALGAMADMPMCEFWSPDNHVNATYSCIEAASVAHVLGKPLVGAEAFTANWGYEGFTAYPGAMKNQSDWAFAAGINKFFYHTFTHKALPDHIRPGMTMGGFGIHWDRGQTWWDMSLGYHEYMSRCSFLLRQGITVADILYLAGSNSPYVFRAPKSVLEDSDAIMPDRKGYNFDGCTPEMLMLTEVMDGNVVFPSGATYRILVLPDFKMMLPEVLMKIESLVESGATIIGNPPLKSPSLVNYPECDLEIQAIAERIWGTTDISTEMVERQYGKGRIMFGGELSRYEGIDNIYPSYEATKKILDKITCEDFMSDADLRYTHKRVDEMDIYFVSNKSNQSVAAKCVFRTKGASVEQWNPLTGELKRVKDVGVEKGNSTMTLSFEPHQSFFVLFSDNTIDAGEQVLEVCTTEHITLVDLSNDWKVNFDPEWGGPAEVDFPKLTDWSKSDDEGIKYYSGIAVYKKSVALTKKQLSSGKGSIYLELGEVNVIARVKVNGAEAGIVWTDPWRVDITNLLKAGENKIEIEVANLWGNRLIGDEQKPFDGLADGQWPDWIKNNTPRTSGRYTFITAEFYKADSELFKSGLIGPVRIVQEK